MMIGRGNDIAPPTAPEEAARRLLDAARARADAIVAEALGEAARIRQEATREALALYDAATSLAGAAPSGPLTSVEESSLRTPIQYPTEQTQVAIIASPFPSFAALVAFQSAIAALPGVVQLTLRRFVKGRLWLDVRYDGIVPLRKRLDGLDGFEATVIAESPEALELHVAPLTAEAAGNTDRMRQAARSG